MRVEHRLTIVSTCPVNGARDEYACTITTDRVVSVEVILAAVEELTQEPIFQEDLTRFLAKDIQAEVETVGTHSGVTTTCRCSA